METLEQKISALTERINAIADQAEKNPADAADLKALISDEIQPQLQELLAAKAEEDSAANAKALSDELAKTQKALQRLRTPGDIFRGALDQVTDEKALVYAPGSGESFFADVVAHAQKNDSVAQERLAKALGVEPGNEKAMTSGDPAGGGYLVPEIIINQLIGLREDVTVIRGITSHLSITSDKIRLPKVISGLTAGWVAELEEKPEGEFVFGEITAEVHTAAGLAVVSNQLLADARPSIDGLIAQDLGVRLANLEEVAFINGSGTGQPLGIVNTPGIGSISLTDDDVQALLDAIYDAITKVEEDYVGSPSHILMHPRDWARIEKARGDSQIQYLVGSGANSEGRRASDPRPGKSLFGVPVVTTRNVPTNLGGGTETTVVVGAFREAWVIDREGVTLDSSPHVYFTSNQTIFRAEERVGFTAERYPEAFCVVEGSGLAL